ncbi:MAG TPA: carboxymuconolactone decarboxylase family protein [candidate division Zixibacteria bacterium]|nr:carboxymuconolactone decarboxylase family protein [candidate division Zixibacteria bacterium]
MSSDMAKFRENRTKMNERIFAENFTPINRFFKLDTSAYEAGALGSKTKELMGLSISTAMRCDDCIRDHLDRAISEGATRAEIVETLNIALIVGGSIVIPHLRRAFEAMDELLDKRD